MAYIIVGIAFSLITAVALYLARVKPLEREQERLQHELHTVWSVLGPVAQWAYRISHGHARVDQMADTWPRGKPS